MANIAISVVVPCYNEQEVLMQTHARLTQVLSPMRVPYEIIYVDDGSRDETLSILKGLHREDAHVVVISFARNFGQQAASSAGLDASRGQAVVLIDADLQDPPELIPQMIELWQQGVEVVYGKRKKRAGENLFKKMTSALYYRIFRWLSDSNAPLDTGDFRLMDRKVVDALNAMGEHNRYLRGMVNWVGFTQQAIEFDRKERAAGQTKYGLKQMLRLASDGIFSFSIKPLTLATRIGGLVTFGAVAAWIVQLILRISGYVFRFSDVALVGLFFLMGILFMCLGLMGSYLGRISEESKNRPIYIVSEFYRRKQAPPQPVVHEEEGEELQ